MKKGKTIESMDGELQWPEVIIQHIQSFLDRRQAARTSVLSKSWHSAYSTRPILDFEERDFQVEEVFAEFVNRTMQRYHELKLNIADFRLQIKVTNFDSASLANEFITKALQLSVNDFSLEIISSGRKLKYVLPVQVFETKSLLKLSVAWCKIDQQLDGVMICSNLESLSFNKVWIGDDMLRDIMLRCPVLETLYLSQCMGLLNVNLSKLHKLKKFSVTNCRGCKVRSPLIDSEEQTVGPSICNRVNVPEYGILSCLMLEQVRIDDFFFHDFSLKFPCLEDLSLHHCNGYKDIEISSRSLKYISLMHKYELKKAKFEVPSICKFKFSAMDIPSTCFITSREYESYISLTCRRRHAVGGSWFLALKKFLTELSSSRTSLKITICLDGRHCYMEDNRGSPVPLVENLKVQIYPSSLLCSAVLESVFWSCRPKFITICDDDDILARMLPWPQFISRYDNEHLRTRKLLCKLLVQQARLDCSYSTPTFPYMNDLEEVNVESFEETHKEWRPLPCQALFDFLKIQENKERLRLRLRWRAHTGDHFVLRT